MRLREIKSVRPVRSFGLLDVNNEVLTKIVSKAKPLPNSEYFYSIIPSTHNGATFYDYDISLLDPKKQLIGMMTVQIVEDTAYVKMIELSQLYRGLNIGLSSSFYGILLSVLKIKNIVSDSTQTDAGARMWAKVSSIPGVTVMGLMYGPSKEQIEAFGASHYQGNMYVFPVKISGERLIAVKPDAPSLYSKDDNKINLIAIYGSLKAHKQNLSEFGHPGARYYQVGDEISTHLGTGEPITGKITEISVRPSGKTKELEMATIKILSRNGKEIDYDISTTIQTNPYNPDIKLLKKP